MMDKQDYIDIGCDTMSDWQSMLREDDEGCTEMCAAETGIAAVMSYLSSTGFDRETIAHIINRAKRTFNATEDNDT